MQQKRSRMLSLRNILFAVLIIGMLYAGILIYDLFRPVFVTETAIDYTVSDSMSVQGLILFQEEGISAAGNIGYLVGDGERVSQGMQIAEIYTDPNQSALRQELSRLEGEISLLTRSQNASTTQISLLSSQRDTALLEVIEMLQYSNLSQLQNKTENYLLAENRMQIITGAVENFTELLNQLEAQKATVLAELGNPQAITAGKSGYFVSSQAASFYQVTLESALAQTPAEWKATLQSEYKISGEGYIGKLVTDYNWYFVGLCSEEESLRFQKGDRVGIAFDEQLKNTYSATVESITVDAETKTAKFVLCCNTIDTNVMEQQNGHEAIITFGTYEGLRVRSSSVHLVLQEFENPETGEVTEEYVRGVYVRYGNIVRFRRIEPLYETKDYIVLDSSSDNNEVRRYDEIIIQGKDLYDGKLL